MTSTAEDLLQSLRQQSREGQNSDAEQGAGANIAESLGHYYQRVRQQSLKLCSDLEIEDFQLQADAFVSPTKWHLAHTSWFFETFILKTTPDYQAFHPQFEYLFNSYYNAVGQQYPRDKRGLMSRPTVQEVKAYRQYVDQRLLSLLNSDNALSQEQND